MGCLYSVDWNGPLDYWNGPLDYWNGLLDNWNGLLEHACHKFEVSMTIVHMHACMRALLKRKGYFNNGSVAGVASLSFYVTQLFL